MKRFGVTLLGALLALSTTSTALAAPATGSTAILGSTGGVRDGLAHASMPTDVDVSIVGGAPIVPYEYSLVNTCWFSGKVSTPADSYERFDLIGPWFVGSDGLPHSTVSVNNNPVPTGAVCRVFVAHDNTTVKGSTTTYPVVS